MGVIDRFIGVAPTVTALGSAATGMAEVFTRNATRRMELDEQAFAQAIQQHGAEFAVPRQGWFDGFVNGLNRMPRPLLALGTMGLFIYAMVEPVGFGLRMQGLQMVPEPLWWLMGAIVGFYFGAREAHHFRNRNWAVPAAETSEPATPVPVTPVPVTLAAPADQFADNAALRDWARSLGK
ncbi:holin family protein [Paracoccus sp. 1_MG-2023]|uniref:holin family protein n=1 Tax=unclassified Paracoccus (in: a-proteobacteria) TaxID=2688777 RepID=UPI001C08C93C|nr:MULTISPECIES: holin family protein [unclassified Paracoccus (in: a-proteobacteria)]MBU2956756.1 holin family protein [Paracoccus sp. C2R09]MDO6669205.1 holin family protein [Paracoccus sp. 1_MG-2023]